MYCKVDICGIDTTKLPVLTEAKKQDLLKKCKAGDKQARKQLIESNLRLVLSVIQRFAGRGENPDDLFQVGCIGLMKSIDHFDPSHEVRFSTYAVPMIVGEIRRHLRDYNTVRVSRSLKDLAYRAMQTREALSAKLNREPSVDEIAAHLSLPKQEVVMALEAVCAPISLYEPVYSDGGDTIYVMDQLGSGEQLDDWTQEICLRESIKQLAPRERSILQKRFIQGKTQVEVASEIGISQAQVSRLEKAALQKIKAAI